MYISLKEDCCKTQIFAQSTQTEVSNLSNYSSTTLICLHKPTLTAEIPRSIPLSIPFYETYFHESWLSHCKINLTKNNETKQDHF